MTEDCKEKTVKTKWGEGDKKLEEITCSLVPEPDIYLELKARQKIVYLMEEYLDREWLAYLLGDKDDTGDVFIEDISVPPHKEAYYASAEAEPFHIPEGCVGVIHSHHKMGATHSGTDDAHVDRNFPVSVVVARGQNGGLAYNAVSFQTTKCGQTVLVEATVKYVQPEPQFEVEAWLTEAKDNIDKGKFVAQAAPVFKHNKAGNGSKGSITTFQPKPVVKQDKVNEIKQAVFDNRGIVLTRAEIEDAVASVTAGMEVPEGVAYWMYGGE